MAEIIRPILRGRDIKRYGYDFADKWLITTFPSKRYDIDKYPDVRDYLLTFDKRVLEQSGMKDIGGIKGKNARKKTNNKWFETQDSINYWDEFNKPKIVWNRIASKKEFALVEPNLIISDSMHFVTGAYLEYIYCFLNSKTIGWMLNLTIGNAVGGNAANADNIKNLAIPIPVKDIETKIENAYKNNDYDLIDQIVFATYHLNDSEINFILNSLK